MQQLVRHWSWSLRPTGKGAVFLAKTGFNEAGQQLP
jgi:hypothetical protein